MNYYNSTLYLLFIIYYIYGDNMRCFYVYNINDHFCDVYNKYPYKLYKILEDAYLSNKYNSKNSSIIFDSVTDSYNKLFVNNYIFANNRFDIYYCNKNNIHLISNRKEYSKLIVTSYCLKIKSSINYPKFFENIHKYSENIFICDYDNKDYFWLNRVINNKEDFDKIIN